MAKLKILLSKLKGNLPVVLGSTLVIVLIVYTNFSQYQDNLTDTGNAAPVSVFVQNPPAGSIFELGNVVGVQAIASGPGAVSVLEFYVDGALAETKAAPFPTGVLNFQSAFYWTAAELGTHNFQVRAVGPNGLTATSAYIPVDVVEEGAAEAMGLDSPYTQAGAVVPLSQLGGGNVPVYNPAEQVDDEDGAEQPPAPPENPPTDPVDLDQAPPYENLNTSLVTWLGNLFLVETEGPEAPGIPATAVESCRPRIWISDNSDNETGFHVYRRNPGQANFVKIATLAAYDGPVFTYDDDEQYGVVQYYVSAFNGAGQSASQLATVEILSENCAPDNSPVLSLNLLNLFDGVDTQMGYCYTAIGNGPWTRVPADPGNFFNPVAEVSEGLSQLVLAGVDETTPSQAACWGWVDGGLQFLGDWQASGEFPEMTTLDSFDSNIAFSEWGPPVLTKLPYHPQVPIPVAYLGSGNQVCADHVGNNLFLILTCADIADDLDYVAWDLGECPADTCYQASDIVGYNVYDSLHDAMESPATTQDPPISLYFMINGTSCDPRNVYVTALVEKNGEMLESWPSNMVFYNGNPGCGFLFGEKTRTYRVTLDTIDFSVGNIDDGVDDEDDAEGYGYVILKPSSQIGGAFWNMEQIHEFSDNAEDNPVRWRNIILTKCNNPLPCYHWFNDAEVGAVNNTGEMELYIGDWASVFIYLQDEDEGLDDLICNPPTVYFDTYDVDTAPNQRLEFTRTGAHADATCQVKFFVELID